MRGEVTDRVRRWMFEEALPFWASAGLDRIHGGAVESLTVDGAGPAPSAFKRARVACRQLYVFSHAEALGWSGAEACADHVYEHLVARFWQGPDAGWLRRVTPEGDPLDWTPDLYDYAFALFGLGWRYKVRRDPQALALALETLDLLERRFRHPSGLGFHAALPPGLPREQNPHMHLIEAALVVAETSGEARFHRLADEIAGLFKSHLCRADGVFPEFYDDAWRPCPERGRWVEPGHQFEWAWILARHQSLTGANHAGLVAALVGSAERFGVDPATGVVFAGVRDDGEVLDRSSRTWPNCERIKGWLGHAALNGVDATGPVEQSVQVLFKRYFHPAPAGAWIDAFHAEGSSAIAAIPASTLYHVFLAFAEVLHWANSPAQARS